MILFNAYVPRTVHRSRILVSVRRLSRMFVSSLTLSQVQVDFAVEPTSSRCSCRNLKGAAPIGNGTKSEATARLLKLGLCPRLLPLELAAAYVGLSAPAFLVGVGDGRYPAPLKDGRLNRWDRKALDVAVDRRSGLEPSSRDGADELMRAIDAA